MPQKKDNLPINADVDLQNGGTITYANEVIAIIAGVAANEIDGVAGMCISGGFSDIIGKNRNITRGVKVEIGSEEAAVDLFTIIEYGKPIQKVASEVQENVRKAIESMTGLHVVRVDVHVQGVSFEKEKIAAQSSLEAARNPVLAEPAAKVEPEAPAREETPAPEPEAPCECETCAVETPEAPCECEACAVETPETPCECETCAVETPEAPCECETCADETPEAPCECEACADEAPEAPCECEACADEAPEAPCECETCEVETPEAPAGQETPEPAPEPEAPKDEPGAKKRRPRKRS